MSADADGMRRKEAVAMLQLNKAAAVCTAGTHPAEYCSIVVQACRLLQADQPHRSKAVSHERCLRLIVGCAAAFDSEVPLDEAWAAQASLLGPSHTTAATDEDMAKRCWMQLRDLLYGVLLEAIKLRSRDPTKTPASRLDQLKECWRSGRSLGLRSVVAVLDYVVLAQSWTT